MNKCVGPLLTFISAVIFWLVFVGFSRTVVEIRFRFVRRAWITRHSRMESWEISDVPVPPPNNEVVLWFDNCRYHSFWTIFLNLVSQAMLFLSNDPEEKLLVVDESHLDCIWERQHCPRYIDKGTIHTHDSFVMSRNFTDFSSLESFGTFDWWWMKGFEQGQHLRHSCAVWSAEHRLETLFVMSQLTLWKLKCSSLLSFLSAEKLPKKGFLKKLLVDTNAHAAFARTDWWSWSDSRQWNLKWNFLRNVTMHQQHFQLICFSSVDLVRYPRSYPNAILFTCQKIIAGNINHEKMIHRNLGQSMMNWRDFVSWRMETADWSISRADDDLMLLFPSPYHFALLNRSVMRLYRREGPSFPRQKPVVRSNLQRTWVFGIEGRDSAFWTRCILYLEKTTCFSWEMEPSPLKRSPCRCTFGAAVKTCIPTFDQLSLKS